MEATEAVRAYAQTYIDILADPAPTINDINHVAANPQLDIDLRNLQQQLRDADDIVYESTGPITVASADPLEVDVEADPPTVVLLACVDRTSVKGTEDGEPRTGRREALRYQVVKTDYLPEPGWAVSRILPPQGEVQPRPC